MENSDVINFKNLVNNELKEVEKKLPIKHVKIYKSCKNKEETKESKYKNDKNSFRKKYRNEKIKNPTINRTLNDIYNTIKSINKINQKICTIVYKRQNTNDYNDTSENIQNKFIENKKFNEYSNINNSNIKGDKKVLIRAHYSYDNIITRNDDFSLLNNKDDKNNKIKFNNFQNKTENNKFLYISSNAPKELNCINKINNKLNYDYNDINLTERLNKYKNKLKRNKTYGNILDLNYFRNSKNIKEIIMLEKFKQNELKKLENIKKQKLNFMSNRKNRAFKLKNQNNITNKQVIKNKPFCFNDNFDKINEDSNNSKTNYSNNYFNKFFKIVSEDEEYKNMSDDKNYNTNLTNKLNFNYEIYKNILNNN